MRLLCALALLGLALAGCTREPPPGPVDGARPEPGFWPIVGFRTDLGDFYVEVYDEMVPLTARNFLDYVRSKFYEGIKVHRTVPGFVVQLGDPNTRDPTKSPDTWGRGDPRLPRIPDEFNPSLRHDAAGVVSMANSGPHSGTSQFFITLNATPHLDDRHAVFGRVVAGMDVVRRISELPHDEADRPLQEVVVRATELIDQQRRAEDVRHGLRAWTFQPAWNASANRTLQLGVVVANDGNTMEPVTTRGQVPEGWTFERVQPEDPRIPAGWSRLFLFWVRAPANATAGAYDATVELNASRALASVAVRIHVQDLGEAARDGANATVHYTGSLLDGRVFDTSRLELARNESIPKFGSVFQRRPDAAYTPLEFTISDPRCEDPAQAARAVCLIRGFNNGTRLLRVGETRTFLLTVASAYGPAAPGDANPLAGRELAFTIELLGLR